MNKFYLLIPALEWIFAFTSMAQPSDLMITYDANQGVSGLAGASKVYMYAGAVTSGPTGQWEWITGSVNLDNGVGLMTDMGNNVWSICIDPASYFGTGLPILAIDIIFRNENGSAFGYDFNGNYIILDLTTPVPTSSFNGVSTANCAVGFEEINSIQTFLDCYPNPVKDKAEIFYRVTPSCGNTRIKILNTLGEVVNEFNCNRSDQNILKINWDGKNSKGNALPNGVYFIQLCSNSAENQLRKIVICK